MGTTFGIETGDRPGGGICLYYPGKISLRMNNQNRPLGLAIEFKYHSWVVQMFKDIATTKEFHFEWNPTRKMWFCDLEALEAIRAKFPDFELSQGLQGYLEKASAPVLSPPKPAANEDEFTLSQLVDLERFLPAHEVKALSVPVLSTTVQQERARELLNVLPDLDGLVEDLQNSTYHIPLSGSPKQESWAQGLRYDHMERLALAIHEGKITREVAENTLCKKPFTNAKFWIDSRNLPFGDILQRILAEAAR